MSTIPVMPTYVADILADLKAYGLTLEQGGAYAVLMWTSWKRRKPHPDDPGHVARVLGCTKGKWLKKLRPVLLQFFECDEAGNPLDGVLRQKRLEATLDVAIERKKRKAEASKIDKKSGKNGAENCDKTPPENDPDSRTRASLVPALVREDSESTARTADPVSEAIGTMERDTGLRNLRRIAGGNSDSGGRWTDQQRRDEYAVQQCVPHLPGRDDGERWGIALAAEDPASPEHASACRMMRKAAREAGVGWVSPERRMIAGGATAA